MNSNGYMDDNQARGTNTESKEAHVVQPRRPDWVREEIF